MALRQQGQPFVGGEYLHKPLAPIVEFAAADLGQPIGFLHVFHFRGGKQTLHGFLGGCDRQK